MLGIGSNLIGNKQIILQIIEEENEISKIEEVVSRALSRKSPKNRQNREKSRFFQENDFFGKNC
jgi:hypothetical protein